MYEFEWDLNKAELNLKKHGFTFEEAKEVFDDIDAEEKYDWQNSTFEESRFQVIGRVRRLIVVIVVYTPRNKKIRIISAREATSGERKGFYDRLKARKGY